MLAVLIRPPSSVAPGIRDVSCGIGATCPRLQNLSIHGWVSNVIGVIVATIAVSEFEPYDHHRANISECDDDVELARTDEGLTFYLRRCN